MRKNMEEMQFMGSLELTGNLVFVRICCSFVISKVLKS